MLNFLYTAVSWVLLRWHQLFTAIGIDKDSGLNWTLSIVFLVITARVLLFRLFIRQVHYQRHMAEMQPKIQALREKYKNDKAEQQRQLVKLQQEEGFNPLSGCLPAFLQIPVFIGLLHVLRHLAAAAGAGYPADKLALYGFTAEQTRSAAAATLFGGAPLAARFHDSAATIADLGGHLDTTRLTIMAVVVLSATATFLTQWLSRRTQSTEPQSTEPQSTEPLGTAATVQRLMLWAVPLFTLGSGLFLPLGVLVYWLVSNSWTAAQQAYVLRFHPRPPAPSPRPGGSRR